VLEEAGQRLADAGFVIDDEDARFLARDTRVGAATTG